MDKRDSSCGPNCGCSVNRRDVLKIAAAGVMAAAWGGQSIAGPFEGKDFEQLVPADKKLKPEWVKSLRERGQTTTFSGPELVTIGMPVGGICAGQLYLGGDGKLWHWDIFNITPPGNFTNGGGPNYAKPPKPLSPIEQGFAIKLTADGKTTIKTLDTRGFDPKDMRFRQEYPIGVVEYRDKVLPVEITLEAFSPFIPLNVNDSALPATIMAYTVKNTSAAAIDVEIAGWLQNGVSLLNGLAGMGRRENRITRDAAGALLHCTAIAEKQPDAPARPDVVFEDFENGYGKWTVEGEAFGKAPATGTLDAQQPVSGFEGKGLVNSFLKGDSTTGRLLSQPFKIERRHISFLIGGGSLKGQTCMNLLVDNKQVRTATGKDNERLVWQNWDVAQFAGREARLEIVDKATGPWGHINVDQITFTDRPKNSVPVEQAEDFGSMGLMVLGADAAGTAKLGATPGETIFAAAPADAASEPFENTLLGGVTRKLRLAAGETGQVVFLVTWYFPQPKRERFAALVDASKLRKSYGKRFESAGAVAKYIATNLDRLAGQTRLWRDTWYGSTLPHWLLERVLIPICTLATSTCYQWDNGRFYAYEGVLCCDGTCQHVWNYAHSVARIFPELERDLRVRTDFGTAWHENGAIDYRGEYGRHVAHDGQCGVIMRTWREHLMCPDDTMLKAIWPRVKKSIEFLITCDGDENGILEGEQYNTLDASWWGAMAWISSFYIGALRAGEAMAKDVGDAAFAQRCATIAQRGSDGLVKQLYNGEYFIHKPDPKHPDGTNTNQGCHIDQLMGNAWAMQVGLGRLTPEKETLSALKSIWKYNFTPDVGPYREKSFIKGGRWYAMAGEGGVIMTTFPRGGIETASGKGGFAYYFNEVWTGQEHQIAAHMMWEGMIDEALVITRVVQDRHHASRRNPYNEVECSDHYSRAMASHGTFVAACGFEYHGPKGQISFMPRLSPEDFNAPFVTAEGWGTFSQRKSGDKLDATMELKWGKLRLREAAFAWSGKEAPAKVTCRIAGKDVPAKVAIADGRAVLTLAAEATIEAGAKMEVTLG